MIILRYSKARYQRGVASSSTIFFFIVYKKLFFLMENITFIYFFFFGSSKCLVTNLLYECCLPLLFWQCTGVINLGGEVGCMISEGPWIFVGLPNVVKVRQASLIVLDFHFI
jgi:hypothetical protein